MQIVGINQVFIAQRKCPLQYVFQLPNVTREVVTAQAFGGSRSQAGRVAFVFPSDTLQYVVGQQGDVVGSVPQWWYRQFDHVDTVEQVLAEAAFLYQLRQVFVVALRMRMSTAISWVSPTGRTAFSWMARSSFTCMARGRSATSSRKRVPPSALRNRPGLLSMAPVKLPFLWPKNSLSISSDGMAPQLTAMNGPSARGPCRWIIRATSSLPLPDSPLINTGAWLRASLRVWLRSLRICGDSPSSRPGSSLSSGGCSLGSDSFRALFTSSRRRGSSTGLETKSKAPAFSDSMAVSMLP